MLTCSLPFDDACGKHTPQASDQTRQTRGWAFTANVDDADSECALDNREWDYTIENNGTSIDGPLAQLMAMIAAARRK